MLAGSRVTVHFDSMYKGIDAVSSRSARLLGGNRVLAEVRLLPQTGAWPAVNSDGSSTCQCGGRLAFLGGGPGGIWLMLPPLTCCACTNLAPKCAQPFEFVAGSRVSGMAVRKISDADNGLFAGTGGPKPPPALSSAVLGMRVGGKRSLIVPPELGYGDKGEQEIPPGATFELRVEVLAVSA